MTYIAYADTRPASKAPIFIALVSLLFGLLMLSKAWLHADMTHAGDAEQGRNCFNHYGSFETWVERTTGDAHFLCKYPGEKRVYDVIAEVRDGRWVEKSTYVPKDGTYGKVLEFLRAVSRKAVRVNPSELNPPPPTAFEMQ